jgi:high-affinity iron transporter
VFRVRGRVEADRREEVRTTMKRYRLRQPFGIMAMALTCLLWYAAAAGAPGTPEQAPLILHMLDYMAVDYPEFVQEGVVLDEAEYKEQVEFSQQVQSMLTQLPAHPDQPDLLHQATQLIALIQAKSPGPEVAALATHLRWGVIRAYNVEVAPQHLPDLRTAASLYQSQCSGCHGPQGQGDGPAAASLDPSPSNFHERQRMDQRSLYSLYSTVTLGVQGTGMSSFRMLGDEERWALAFYVGNLAHDEANRKRGAELWQSGVGHTWFPDLASVATATVSDVRAEHGDDAVAVLVYLRSHPERVVSASEAPLARSSRLLRESLEAYRLGQAQAAQELAVSAYLDGFELVEASLDTVDKPFRVVVEAEMLRYRAMLKNGEPLAAVEGQAGRIQELLAEAQHRLARTQLPTSATFFSAFVILLREGLEAVLVLAAIFALLIRAGRRDALPYVHAGWIAALVLGGITWLVASYVIVISGATREVTEGVTALVAAAILLYVGFWMHRKAYADRWRTFLQGQLHDALSARTMWALALVSFLAVYREAFETVLFYQALWIQAAPAYVPVLGGLLVAAVALVVLSWLILRGSIRLPIGLFFGATSLLLALLAVIFVGKGVAALQEAGTLPIDPVNVPAIPALGVYPNLLGLALQVSMILLIGGVFAYTHYTASEMR